MTITGYVAYSLALAKELSDKEIAKYVDVKDDVIKRRDEIAHAMLLSQLEEAKKLSVDWKARPSR